MHVLTGQYAAGEMRAPGQRSSQGAHFEARASTPTMSSWIPTLAHGPHMTLHRK